MLNTKPEEDIYTETLEACKHQIANTEWHSAKLNPDLVLNFRGKFATQGLELDRFTAVALENHQKNLNAVIFCLTVINYPFDLFKGSASSREKKTLVSAFTALAKLVLADPHDSLSSKRSPFAGDNAPKTIKIGKTLNKQGGKNLMSHAMRLLVPPCDQRELDIIWHGIGDWKC